jgi:site-specific DNA-cytosine methylase
MTQEFTALHLFSGIGGAALGFQQAISEYKGVVGRFRTLAGVDVDEKACKDFEALTGAPAAQIDLFSRDDFNYQGQVYVKCPREGCSVTIEQCRQCGDNMGDYQTETGHYIDCAAEVVRDD